MCLPAAMRPEVCTRARHRRELPRQGRDRRPRRARDRRPRTAQSRPYLRPRAGSGVRLFRPAAARRSDRHRHGARIRLLGARKGLLPRPKPSAPSVTWLRSDCRRGSSDIPGPPLAARPADGTDRRRTRKSSAESLHSSWCAGSARPSSRPASIRPRCARFSARSLPSDDFVDWLTVAAILICLLVSAFFSASETALTASSRAAMMRLEKQGNRDAGIVNRLLATRERLLGAVLFANNLTNIAASTLGDRPAAGVVRQSRRDLRHDRDDGADLRRLRSAAEDRRLQHARPHGACGRAADRPHGALVLCRSSRRSNGWCGSSCAASACRSARSSRSCRRARNCAAPSISCIAPASWKSSTAT